MISKKRYGELLNKKRLTKKEEKELDRALFVNYCKCIKKIKYSNEYEVGKEYPICMSSIYKKRGRTAPKGVTKKCKRYYQMSYYLEVKFEIKQLSDGKYKKQGILK